MFSDLHLTSGWHLPYLAVNTDVRGTISIPTEISGTDSDFTSLIPLNFLKFRMRGITASNSSSFLCLLKELR